MFKAIPGYEGIYEVDESGIVRTAEGKQTNSVRHGVRTWSQRILKQKNDKNGYMRVTLYKDKKARTWLVHRLVALSFLETKHGQSIVNHIDGNPANNHFSNLEWCDYKHNNNHAFDNGLIKTGIPTKLVNVETKEEISFRSQSAASRFLGKSTGYLNEVIRRNETTIDKYLVVTQRTE